MRQALPRTPAFDANLPIRRRMHRLRPKPRRWQIERAPSGSLRAARIVVCSPMLMGRSPRDRSYRTVDKPEPELTYTIAGGNGENNRIVWPEQSLRQLLPRACPVSH